MSRSPVSPTPSGPAPAATPADLIPELPHLLRTARALTRNAAAAEDLVHDCLVNAMENLDRFEPGTNLRAWLRRILRNRFLSDLRRHGCHDRYVASVDWVARTTAPADQYDVCLLRRVADDIDRLPADQRTVLRLAVLDDMSYQDTADAIGVPVGTVRSRLSRARDNLRGALEGGRGMALHH
ncbi:MAG: RNA polymerase sigma factor [Alphaproteobacteria bacterium]